MFQSHRAGMVKYRLWSSKFGLIVSLMPSAKIMIRYVGNNNESRLYFYLITEVIFTYLSAGFEKKQCNCKTVSPKVWIMRLKLVAFKIHFSNKNLIENSYNIKEDLSLSL